MTPLVDSRFVSRSRSSIFQSLATHLEQRSLYRSDIRPGVATISSESIASSFDFNIYSFIIRTHTLKYQFREAVHQLCYSSLSSGFAFSGAFVVEAKKLHQSPRFPNVYLHLTEIGGVLRLLPVQDYEECAALEM